MHAVFGANGFIGRNVVRRLDEAGIAVRAVSRRFDPDFVAARAKGAESVTADLGDTPACRAALDGVDTVLQLVSATTPALKNDQLEQDVLDNVIPHLRFAQQCVDAGVRRHVFISSGGTVYGRAMRLPIDEAHPEQPLCSHGMTKLTVEKYLGLLAETRGLDSVILRVSNVFGPGQTVRRGQGLIPAIVQHFRDDRSVPIFGDGQARRDYVFIDDVVDAILAALVAPGARGGVFNVGSGESRSVLEVLDGIEAILGARLRRHHLPGRDSDVDVNVLDIRRAAAILGWRPRTPFRDALERTVSPERPIRLRVRVALPGLGKAASGRVAADRPSLGVGGAVGRQC